MLSELDSLSEDLLMFIRSFLLISFFGVFHIDKSYTFLMIFFDKFLLLLMR